MDAVSQTSTIGGAAGVGVSQSVGEVTPGGVQSKPAPAGAATVVTQANMPSQQNPQAQGEQIAVQGGAKQEPTESGGGGDVGEIPLEKRNRVIFYVSMGVFVVLVMVTFGLIYIKLFAGY